jgi:hypothetical protein
MGTHILKKMKAKNYIATLSVLIAAGLILNSCKKDKDEAPAPATANGTLAFHFHTNVDTAEVEDQDSVYTTGLGRKITVHRAELYISNVQLIKTDGSLQDVPGVVKLIKRGEEEYVIGSVPAGNYKSVKFNVGLSAAINASTPASSDSTLNQPQMWFGIAAQPSGFVFINFQGTIDTTTFGNGTIAQMQSFTYKIGTNANLKSVTMPDQNYTVSPNQVQFVHMVIDYNMLFNGISLNTGSNLTMNTATDNSGALGMQLVNNISSMFSYEM